MRWKRVSHSVHTQLLCTTQQTEWRQAFILGFLFHLAGVDYVFCPSDMVRLYMTTLYNMILISHVTTAQEIFEDWWFQIDSLMLLIHITRVRKKKENCELWPIGCWCSLHSSSFSSVLLFLLNGCGEVFFFGSAAYIQQSLLELLMWAAKILKMKMY